MQAYAKVSMWSWEIEYFVSVFNVAASKYCIGPLARIKIYFSLLSICTDELILTPKTMTFLPTLPSGNANSEQESNLITKPLYTYSSELAFLVQSFKVKTVFKSPDHASNS